MLPKVTNCTLPPKPWINLAMKAIVKYKDWLAILVHEASIIYATPSLKIPTKIALRRPIFWISPSTTRDPAIAEKLKAE